MWIIRHAWLMRGPATACHERMHPETTAASKAMPETHPSSATWFSGWRQVRAR
jgi:hypothetical protein